MEEIFALVGRIMQTAQFIEWNLALTTRLHILLGSARRGTFKEVEEQAKRLQDEMQKMTMGEIIERVRSVRGVTEGELSMLKRALYDRNYIAHGYFKDNDFTALSYAQFKREKERLTAVLTNMIRLNDSLCALIQRQRAAYEIRG